MTTIGQDLKMAKNFLATGELTAIPTETVYGLAGNALNPKSISRIFEVKNRPRFNPLIIHTSSISKVYPLINDLPDIFQKLTEVFWPGALTLIFDKSDKVSDMVTAGSPKVAVRIPDHPLTLKLLNNIDFPLAAPSANPFGYVSPTTAKHVNDQLGGEIPYILDGGECKVGLESTIIGMYEGQPMILRKGGISTEEIEMIVGPIKIKTSSDTNPDAPGMLTSHYSPVKPLIMGEMEEMLGLYSDKKIGVISFAKDYPSNKTLILSPKGSFKEAAKKLFSTIRKLDDDKNIDIILAERLPDQNLGKTINDRLQRASCHLGKNKF